MAQFCFCFAFSYGIAYQRRAYWAIYSAWKIKIILNSAYFLARAIMDHVTENQITVCYRANYGCCHFHRFSAILWRILKINSSNPRTCRIDKNCHFWCHLCIADWTACVHWAFAHTNYGNNNVDVCFISILFNVNNNSQRQWRQYGPNLFSI